MPPTPAAAWGGELQAQGGWEAWAAAPSLFRERPGTWLPGVWQQCGGCFEGCSPQGGGVLLSTLSMRALCSQMRPRGLTVTSVGIWGRLEDPEAAQSRLWDTAGTRRFPDIRKPFGSGGMTIRHCQAPPDGPGGVSWGTREDPRHPPPQISAGWS